MGSPRIVVRLMLKNISPPENVLVTSVNFGTYI